MINNIGIGIPFALKVIGGAIAALFAKGEQGVWYDPSDISLNWRRNLLSYTQEFDNAAWSKSDSSIIANSVIAPNGTQTADKIVEAATTAVHFVSTFSTFSIVAGNSYTQSIYVKAAERNWIRLIFSAGGFGSNLLVFFNISTGQIGTTSAGIAATITDVGNGWYRCTATATATISASINFNYVICSADNTAFYAGNGTSGLYVWGAQLEVGSTATAYQRIVTPEISYLDVQSQPILYQDAAGTTPVTAVEQPVGRILDKSGRGNHAFQATSASRPTLSARYNLLTYSEQFDNAAWASAIGGTGVTPVKTVNYTIAPDGTTTACRMVFDRGSGTSIGTNYSYIRQNLVTFGVPAKFSFWIKSNTGTNQTIACLYSSPASYLVTATPSWQLITVTFSNASDAYIGFGLNGSATPQTADISVWHPDFRVTNDALNQPSYQRIAAATNYDTVGFKPYLRFDGTDDSLATNSIDFTATDKMTVWAGVRKLSDAAAGFIAELGNTSSTLGSFGIGNSTSLSDVSRRTWFITQYATTPLGGVVGSAFIYSSPDSKVFTGLFNAGAASQATEMIIRLNTSQQTLTFGNANLNSGNFGNYPLYIGRRGDSSLPFNGRLYQLIVRGAQSTDAEISNGETYTNAKTGAY